MNNRIELKEEDPLSNDIALQNEEGFFTKFVTTNPNSTATLLNNDCEVPIKTEVKLEPSFPNFCSQKDWEYSTKCDLKQIKPETVTCSSNCEIYMKMEVEETLAKDCGFQNSDTKVDNKIQIKPEPLWQEIETSTGCDDIIDGNFPIIKSSRLSTNAVSDDSNDKLALPITEDPDMKVYNGRDCPEYDSKRSYVRKTPIVEEQSHTEQPGNCSNGRDIYETLCSKQRSSIYKSKRLHRCTVCDKSFTELSSLKRHHLIHEGKKPYQCKTCKKSFTQMSHLKRHNLIHEGKKSHQCKTCEKSFTHFSYLKTHYLFHEGKKPHQCITCNKRFTLLSNLKTHSLIHEGKKLHHCKTCDKSFTQLSTLKSHNLIHEGKKPHQCKTCYKSFARMPDLKRHNLIHQSHQSALLA